MTRGGEMRYKATGIREDVWHKPEAYSRWKGEQRCYSWGLFKETKSWIEHSSGVVYRQRHRFKDETRYFIGSPSAPRYLDTEAYVKLGSMVLLSDE